MNLITYIARTEWRVVHDIEITVDGTGNGSTQFAGNGEIKIVGIDAPGDDATYGYFIQDEKGVAVGAKPIAKYGDSSFEVSHPCIGTNTFNLSGATAGEYYVRLYIY